MSLFYSIVSGLSNEIFNNSQRISVDTQTNPLSFIFQTKASACALLQMVKDVLPSAFLKFIWIMLFTLVSVVFVMSPIIHTYRHLSIGVCSYSRSFYEIILVYVTRCYVRTYVIRGRVRNNNL